MEAERGRVPAEIEVDDPGTDPGGSALPVHLDPVHSHQRDDHGGTEGNGSTRQSRSGTARNDRVAVPDGDLDNLGDLFGLFGQHHRRYLTPGDSPIRPVDMATETVRENPIGADEGPEFLDEGHGITLADRIPRHAGRPAPHGRAPANESDNAASLVPCLGSHKG